MQTTVQSVQQFLNAISFSTYADVKDINIQTDKVTVSLADVKGDVAQSYQEIAQKFGFEAVESTSENSTEYLVNVPDKGSFGFVLSNSDVVFVIYNQKYAQLQFKDIFPNFISKVESALTSHVQSIREILANRNEYLKEKNSFEQTLNQFNQTVKNKYFSFFQKKDIQSENLKVEKEKD